MRIDEALKKATAALATNSDSARLDSEILLAHYLGKSRSYLYAWPEVTVTPPVLQHFEQAIEQRKTQYPIAYIIGYQEFWSLKLNVTPDVLIPRADTELLVETALGKLQSIKQPNILELGTGSGAIALALASERPDANILACDYSVKALDVAKQNQQQLAISNVSFLHSDWFKAIPAQHFDLIVSNPPYIDPDDPHLHTSIRFEPLQALCANNQGVADLSHIISTAKTYLKPGSWLLLEHGYDQGEQVPQLFEQAAYQQINCLPDLAGNDRISIGQFVS